MNPHTPRMLTACDVACTSSCLKLVPVHEVQSIANISDKPEHEIETRHPLDGEDGVQTKLHQVQIVLSRALI